MKRALLSLAAAMILPAVAIAGEETTSSARDAGQAPRPGPRSDHRPLPRYWGYERPPVVIVQPRPRLGWTCETPRFACELSRPRPLGDDCSCRSPSGARRYGTVVP